jgi:hypothetical protein
VTSQTESAWRNCRKGVCAMLPWVRRIHAAFASSAHSGLQSIMQASAEAVVRHLDAAFVRIWMLNGPENLLELQASAGQYTRLNGEFARMQVGERHVGFVAQQRKPYIAQRSGERPTHDAP